MTPWQPNQIVWSQVNGQTNVAQISTAMQNGKGNWYWWRNLLPNETLYDACKDFYSGTLNLGQIGTNVASFMVIEYTPRGVEVVQQRGFVASVDELDLFTQG